MARNKLEAMSRQELIEVIEWYKSRLKYAEFLLTQASDGTLH